MPRLTVVVPVHNEAAFLPHGLPMLIDATRSVDPDAQIVVVENGSTDQTAELAEQVGGSTVELIRLPEADYGSAMREGFLAATGDWVVNFDIDYFSSAFLDHVLSVDADLVIGSKRDPRSEDRRPFVRRLATRTFNLLLRALLASKVSDTHGMKGFRREVVSTLADRVVSRQDLYDTELVIRAERAGYRIVEVPVVVEELRAARSSLLTRVPRTLRGLLRIRRALS